MKVEMDPEVFQMFNMVPDLGRALDLRNFELLRQAIVSHRVNKVLVPIKSLSTMAALPMSFLSISRALLAHFFSKSATFLSKYLASPP